MFHNTTSGACQRSPAGFYAPIGVTAPLPCDLAQDLCRYGSGYPLPLAALPNASGVQSSRTLLLHSQTAAVSVGGIAILAIGGALVLLLFILVAALLCWARKRAVWSSWKPKVQGLDLMFVRDHANVNPDRNAGLMIERKTVLGGVFSIFVIIVFGMVATYLTYAYLTEYSLNVSQLPFELTDQAGTPGQFEVGSVQARFVVSITYWGFQQGVVSSTAPVTSCTPDMFQGIASGFSFAPSHSPMGVLTASTTSNGLACNLTWDSGAGACSFRPHLF